MNTNKITYTEVNKIVLHQYYYNNENNEIILYIYVVRTSVHYIRSSYLTKQSVALFKPSLEFVQPMSQIIVIKYTK